MLGCDSNGIHPTYIQLSPDDKSLAFVAHESDRSSIWLLELDSFTSRQIIHSEEGHCYQPLFSHTGKEIYYVFTKDFESSTVFKYSIALNRSELIFKTKRWVNNMAVDSSGFVYFSSPSEYGNYSPLTSPAPHGYNLFKYDPKNHDVKEFIHLDAYSMGPMHLSKDYQYIYTTLIGHIHGMCKIDIAAKKIRRLKVKDNPREPVKEYCYPVSTSDSNFILFSAPYELYGYKFSEEEVVELLVVENKGKLDGMFIGHPRMNSLRTRVYFLAGFPNDDESLYELDMATLNVNNIDLSVK